MYPVMSFATLLCILFSILGITAAQSIFFLPNANITKYQSAMIVPAPPDVLQNTSKVQAIWPGMQPSSSAAVLQNVLANEGSVLGEWWFIPFYCCMPTLRLTDHIQVYPGDVILSTFTRNPFTGVWLDTWQIQPGVIGYAAGQTSLSGNLTFDPSLYTNVGPYTQILLAIELQGNASWASGQVLWKDIIIETEDDGNDTDWCTQPGTEYLEWSSTQPIKNTQNNYTTCYIANVLFEQTIMPNETISQTRKSVLEYLGTKPHSRA